MDARLPVAITLALAFLPTAAASEGHPEFLSADPAPAQQLSQAPEFVRVTFSEDIEQDASTLDVSLQGRQVSTATQSSSRSLQARLEPSLGEGVYSVRWTIVTPADGHASQGGYEFAVGNFTAQGLETSGGGTRWQELVPRLLQYAGYALVAGAALTLLLRGIRPRDAAALQALGAAALVGGSIVMWVRLQDAANLGAAAFAATTPGAMLFARGLLAAGLLVLAVVWLARPSASAGLRAFVTLGMLGAMAWTSGSMAHASAAGAVGAAVDALHLLAGAAWVGGLLVFVLRLPRLGDVGDLRAAGLAFGKIALGSVLVLLVAGMMSAAIVVGWPSLRSPDFWTSRYGALLAAKVILASLMVAIAGMHRQGFLRPEARAAARFPLATGPSAFRRLVTIEAGLGAAVLAVAALLASTPPALAGEDESYQVSGQGTQVGVRIRFDHAPEAPGASTVTLELWELIDRDGRIERLPITPANVGRSGHVQVTVVDPVGQGLPQQAAPAGDLWTLPTILWAQPGTYTFAVHAETAYIIDGAVEVPVEVNGHD